MKKLSRILLSLILLLPCLLQSTTAYGEDTQPVDSGYTINIQKYKIDEQEMNALPLDGIKVDQVTDENGNALEPMAGISYQITRVTPIQGGSGFEAMKGEGAFSTTVTTTASGLASVGGLAQGMYEISEMAHDQLKEVMKPVVVELPFPQREGEPLNEVYIYPKSSAVSLTPKLPNTSGDTPNNPNSPNEPNKRLPQTSGNIGTYQTLLWILAMIVVMGLIGMFNIHRKKDIF